MLKEIEFRNFALPKAEPSCDTICYFSAVGIDWRIVLFHFSSGNEGRTTGRSDHFFAHEASDRIAAYFCWFGYFYVSFLIYSG